jgi:hypothetical protein
MAGVRGCGIRSGYRVLLEDSKIMGNGCTGGQHVDEVINRVMILCMIITRNEMQQVLMKNQDDGVRCCIICQR